MIKFKNLFLIIIINNCSIVFSQVNYTKSETNFGIPTKEDKMTYSTYPEDFLIGINCKSYENCQNINPEQTLMSIISSKNYQWDKKNYDYLIENKESKYKLDLKVNKNKFYFRLLRKLAFENNGIKYSIIKYHIRENLKLVSFCNILILKNNKWFVTKPEKSLSKAYLMFTYLSENSLDAIFQNKNTSIDSFNEQTKNIYSNNFLDFSKAINSSSSKKMSENDLKIILDKTFFDSKPNEFEKFNPNIKLDFNISNQINLNVNYCKELDFQNLYKYKKDEQKDYEIDNEVLTLLNYKQEDVDMIFRFNFMFENKLFTIIKFTNLLSKKIETKIFVKNINWKVLDDNEAKINVFYRFIKMVKLDLLSELISVGENPEYFKINEIKKQIINSDKVLNIYKLTDIIEKNKASLSKYLDE